MNNALEKIIVALDISEREELDKCLNNLKGTVCYVKVGMQLFYAFGPSIVKELKDQGLKIFLDLKVHDIPNTAKGALTSLSSLDVDMINVHATGGSKMMIAAKEAFQHIPRDKRPIMISVTQLTSTSQDVFNNELMINGKICDNVLHLAKLTKKSGLDGVVASAQETKEISKHLGKDFCIVTPGVRFNTENKHDQIRVQLQQKLLQMEQHTW